MSKFINTSANNCNGCLITLYMSSSPIQKSAYPASASSRMSSAWMTSAEKWNIWATLVYPLDVPETTKFIVKRPALDDFPLGCWATVLCTVHCGPGTWPALVEVSNCIYTVGDFN